MIAFGRPIKRRLSKPPKNGYGAYQVAAVNLLRRSDRVIRILLVTLFLLVNVFSLSCSPQQTVRALNGTESGGLNLALEQLLCIERNPKVPAASAALKSEVEISNTRYNVGVFSDGCGPWTTWMLFQPKVERRPSRGVPRLFGCTNTATRTDLGTSFNCEAGRRLWDKARELNTRRNGMYRLISEGYLAPGMSIEDVLTIFPVDISFFDDPPGEIVGTIRLDSMSFGSIWMYLTFSRRGGPDSFEGVLRSLQIEQLVATAHGQKTQPDEKEP